MFLSIERPESEPLGPITVPQTELRDSVLSPESRGDRQVDILMFRLNGSVFGPSKTRWLVRAAGRELALVAQPGKASVLALPRVRTKGPQASHSVLLSLSSLVYKETR